MLGHYTVPEGRRIALWDKHGRRTTVAGPQRIWLKGRRVEPLTSMMAGPAQYLVLKYRDGRVEHRRGPAVCWIDPVDHLGADVLDAVTLDANEALVVYRQDEQSKVHRRIVRGPELFVPDANEWLHEFRWHGADPSNPRKKIPRGLRFKKLRVIPDQMYFDVESVRTADDALVVVKLMIFFELIDIPLMLDQTHDPVADFINAVTADVIDFAASLTFEQFKEKTDRLNARETYPQLAQRAGRIGYRINKVVHRGYEATPKLQAMHDGAIETRTRLRLESETESQAQALADFKLAREQERSVRRQQIEQAEAEHQHRVKRVAHEEQLRQKQVEHEMLMKLQQQEHEAAACRKQQEQESELKHRRALREQEIDAAAKKAQVKLEQRQSAYEQRIAFLKSVRELQVDMTRYLVAKHERPDRRISIDGVHAGRRTQLHLHETS